jgi:hypothetical protein
MRLILVAFAVALLAADASAGTRRRAHQPAASCSAVSPAGSQTGACAPAQLAPPAVTVATPAPIYAVSAGAGSCSAPAARGGFRFRGK